MREALLGGVGGIFPLPDLSSVDLNGHFAALVHVGSGLGKAWRIMRAT
jgi:hypothetical protein